MAVAPIWLNFEAQTTNKCSHLCEKSVLLTGSLTTRVFAFRRYLETTAAILLAEGCKVGSRVNMPRKTSSVFSSE